MKCMICLKNFNKKITFSNLFDSKSLLICDRCYKSYPIKICYSTIPLTNKRLNVYSLYPKDYKINPHAYSIEYSKLYEFVRSNDKRAPVVLLDKFYLSDNMYESLDTMASLFNSDLYIICNYIAD